MIDVVRQIRIQVAQRIVRKSREMNDSFKSLEVLRLDVAQVLPDGRKFSRGIAEGALLEKIAVQSHHFMARVGHQRRHDGADVAFMASQQYSHSRSTPLRNRSDPRIATKKKACHERCILSSCKASRR